MSSADTDRAELYTRIVETASQGVWVIDASGSTTFVNQALADMFGRTREQLIGSQFFDHMRESDRAHAVELLARRRSGMAEVHEFSFVRADGSPLHAQLTTNPLSSESGEFQGALAFVTDIGKQRADEAERAGLWTTLDESFNEIYLFRVDDLRFEHVNRGAIANIGYSLRELRSMTPVHLKPEHTEESFRSLLVPLLEGSTQRLWFETRHRRKDGSSYPVEVRLQLVTREGKEFFLAIINDVSERHAATEALAASEARFRAVIEEGSDLLLLMSPDMNFTFVSPSVERLLGYTPKEFARMPALAPIHPEDVQAAGDALRRVVESGGAEQAQFRLRRKDGAWAMFEGTARSLLANPAVGAIVMNAREVTRERALHEQLEQAQRLESIGRLAGGVAHDFNNILTTISSCASFLESSGRLSEEDLADVIEIRNAGDRAAALTTQLLTFARKRLVRPTTIDLRDVLAQQERFLRRVIGEAVELSSRAPAQVWPVLADPSQVEQVILNLAVNARDAMSGAGRLSFVLDNVELDAAFAEAHPELTPGRYVRLVVSDTGSGIAAADLPHIFEPFFTTKSAGQGTGLGLATVYGIIRQLGGQIWVYSELGVGSTFKLFFPAADGAPASTAIYAQPEPGAGHERILVVEDDERVRRTVVRGLEAGGYEVHACAAPAEAIEWMRAHGGRIDLLLTDVVMPGASGKELASALTRDFPHLRVLYMSGYAEDTIAHSGVLEAGVDLLSKPFSPPALRERVRQILDRTPDED